MGQKKISNLHIVTDIKPSEITLNNMTKLTEWVTVFGVYAGLWCATLADMLPVKMTSQTRSHIYFSPILLAVVFVLYSVTTVLYRVATFNDCEQAADELKEEIKMAKAELSEKGIKFD